MEMPIAKDVWFVVADSERARLLRARPAQHGHVHVEEVDKLATTFATGEHQRPTRLGQPGRMAPSGHEHEEKLAHFARELTRWLERLVAAHTLARCPVFAPSHMLGALRREASPALAAKLQEHACEIAGQSTARLAEHPQVTALLAD
jgi:protein required for attachment to host cells